MPRRYNVLRNCFGYAGFTAFTVFLTLLPVLLRAPLPHGNPRVHADVFSVLLTAMREMILLFPPVVVILNGIAWWTLRKGATSARQWAIAGSISTLVLSAPFFVADVAILRYSLTGVVGFAGVLALFLTLFSLGIIGLAAFSKPDATLVESAPHGFKTDEKGLVALSSAL